MHTHPHTCTLVSTTSPPPCQSDHLSLDGPHMLRPTIGATSDRPWFDHSCPHRPPMCLWTTNVRRRLGHTGLHRPPACRPTTCCSPDHGIRANLAVGGATHGRSSIEWSVDLYVVDHGPQFRVFPPLLAPTTCAGTPSFLLHGLLAPGETNARLAEPVLLSPRAAWSTRRPVRCRSTSHCSHCQPRRIGAELSIATRGSSCRDTGT